MHCISDPCETNCSRCSSHWVGALRAHTVRISSIIAYLPSSETRTVASSGDCGIFPRRPQHLPSPLRVAERAAKATARERGDPARARDFSRSALGKRRKVSQCSDEIAPGERGRIDRGVRRAIERRSGYDGGAPAFGFSRFQRGPRPTIWLDRTRHRRVRDLRSSFAKPRALKLWARSASGARVLRSALPRVSASIPPKKLIISSAIPRACGARLRDSARAGDRLGVSSLGQAAARRARRCAPPRSRRPLGRRGGVVRARRPGGRRGKGAEHGNPAGSGACELSPGLACSPDIGPAH